MTTTARASRMVLSGLVAAFCAMPLAAHAQTLSYMQEDVTACTNDAFRFCSNVITDIPAIKVCLENKGRAKPVEPGLRSAVREGYQALIGADGLAQDRGRFRHPKPAGAFAGPGHELIGTDNNEARLICLAATRSLCGDDFERHPEGPGCCLECGDGRWVFAKSQ